MGIIQYPMNRNIYFSICKAIILLPVLIFISLKSYTQPINWDGIRKTNWELGISFGPSFFLGDLGGNKGKGGAFFKDVNLQLTKWSKGFYLDVHPNKWLGFRTMLNYTFVAGDDAIIKSVGGLELERKARNLDFKSNIWEANGLIELFPLQFLGRNKVYSSRFRPYVFCGVGIFHFNPQGSLTDSRGNKNWYDLQPLKTEGQGMPAYPNSKEYQLTQLNIPLGAGVKYILTERLSVSTELNFRKTFTDYIDDASNTYIDPDNFYKYLSNEKAALAIKLNDKTLSNSNNGVTGFAMGGKRGNPVNNDTYFSFVLNIGVKLGRIYDNPFNYKAVKQTKCPGLF